MTELHVPAKRRLTPGDILPLAEYIPLRRGRRRRVGALKRRRRVEVGPFATFYFENIETMRHQVQEMLYREGWRCPARGRARSHNPLMPQDSELSATVMFEIDDPARRAATLMQLGGIEHHAFIDIAGVRVRGDPDPTRENTSPDGTASSVQFLKFLFDARGNRTPQDFGHGNRRRLRPSELRSYGRDDGAGAGGAGHTISTDGRSARRCK